MGACGPKLKQCPRKKMAMEIKKWTCMWIDERLPSIRSETLLLLFVIVFSSNNVSPLVHVSRVLNIDIVQEYLPRILTDDRLDAKQIEMRVLVLSWPGVEERSVSLVLWSAFLKGGTTFSAGWWRTNTDREDVERCRCVVAVTMNGWVAHKIEKTVWRNPVILSLWAVIAADGHQWEKTDEF